MTPWRSKWRTVFSSVAPIMLQDELLLVWDHPRALDLLRWFSPSETNSIQRLIDKEVTKPNSSTNHYTSPEPVQGRATKRALALCRRHEGAGLLSPEQRWLQATLQQFPVLYREALDGQSQALCPTVVAGQKTMVKLKQEQFSRDTGKPPYSLQGHPSSRAGCPEWSSFHPWMFSSPSWIKPWATFSDTTTSHDLSRRLGWRLPTDQRLQLSDLEIIPATVKMKANFAMFGSNYKLCCEA